MEGQQLGQGWDGLGGVLRCQCGWSSGHQKGVDAEAGEESVDIQGGCIGSTGGGGRGQDGVFVALLAGEAEGGRRVVVVVVVAELALWVGGRQGLIGLEGEVCPQVEVGRKVGGGGGGVLGVVLDGLDDVEAVEGEGGHEKSDGQAR